MTVQRVESAAPAEPGALLYVERRDPFALRRREPWPGGRVLLAGGVAEAVRGMWPTEGTPSYRRNP